jgi:Zn finger protein HypA/HybF involved in hydrogenase expression
MEPIHKFNNGRGAMLCNGCRTIISTGPRTEELLCEKCKQKNMNYTRTTTNEIIVNGHEIVMKDSIVESVIEQLKQRSETGINKYNTTLDRTDLSRLEWLQHLQEELFDASLYIEKLKTYERT